MIKNNIFLLAIIFIAFCFVFETAASGQDLELFNEKYGSFSILIPKGWKLDISTWLGERMYTFTNEEVDYSAKQFKSIYCEGSITLKITANFEDVSDWTAEKLADNQMKLYESVYVKNGMKLKIIGRVNRIIAGLNAVMIKGISDNGEEINIFFKNDDYLYELRMANSKLKHDYYETLYGNIIESLKISKPRYDFICKTFTDPKNDYSVVLPDNWYTKYYDFENNTQFIVSRERIKQKDDMFFTGFTISKIKNYLLLYKVSSDKEMLSALVQSYLTALKLRPSMVIKIEDRLISGNKIVLIEASSQETLYIQTLSLFFVKGNDAYMCTYESLVSDYFYYRPMFLNSVEKLIIG